MRFRKIAPALFACLALGAFLANSASAAEGEGWTIEGSGVIPNGTHQRVSCEKHGTSTLTLTVFLLAKEVELSTTGVDCLEKQGSTNLATIDNTTSKGHSEGVLTFTGVKVLKPSTKCEVKNTGGTAGEITTAALTDQVIMDPTGGTTAVLDRFFPEVGGTWATIEFVGAECPLNEVAAAVNGSECGEAVHTNASGTGYEPNKTGELKVVETLLFGKAQQETGNTVAKPCALTLGKERVQIAGAVDNALAAPNIGKPFGAD